MSVIRFCHNCGKDVQIGAKFCANCGTNLLSLSSRPPVKQTEATIVTPNHDEDDDGEGYIDRLSHANIRQTALHVEIVTPKAPTETVGSVMAAPSPLLPEDYKRDQPFQAIDKKLFMDEFKKEAGTLRND